MFIPDFVKIALPFIGIILAIVIFFYRGNVFTNQITSERFMVLSLLSYGLIDLATRAQYPFIIFAVIFSVSVIFSNGKFYKDKKESEAFFSMMLFLISIMSLNYNFGTSYLV